MSNKTSFNIRIDDDIKVQADNFFQSMGLTLTSAINLFIKQSLLQGELPFKPIADPFYSQYNVSVIKGAMDRVSNGEYVEHELTPVDE